MCVRSMNSHWDTCEGRSTSHCASWRHVSLNSTRLKRSLRTAAVIIACFLTKRSLRFVRGVSRFVDWKTDFRSGAQPDYLSPLESLEFEPRDKDQFVWL